MPKAKFLTRQMILDAQSRTSSNNQAARFLKVSNKHYKKYAKLYKSPDKTTDLYEYHKNESGKGVSKGAGGFNKKTIDNILSGESPAYIYTPKTIKKLIVKFNILPKKCARCGFQEKRFTDYKSPLILNHKDGDKSNFLKENLEFFCYNCSFLYAKSPITDKQVELEEGFTPDDHRGKYDWEIDEDSIEDMEKLSELEESISGKEEPKDNDDISENDLISYSDE